MAGCFLFRVELSLVFFLFEMLTYEKQDPYTTHTVLSPDTTTAEQEFGHKIVARNDIKLINIDLLCRRWK